MRVPTRLITASKASTLHWVSAYRNLGSPPPAFANGLASAPQKVELGGIAQWRTARVGSEDDLQPDYGTPLGPLNRIGYECAALPFRDD